MNRLERPLATGNVSYWLPFLRLRQAGFQLCLAGFSVGGWLTIVASTSAEGPYPTAPPRSWASAPDAGEVLPAAVRSEPADSPTTPINIAENPLLSPNVKPLVCGQIVARVDGQVVLSCDVLWQVNLMLEQNRDKIPPSEIENVRTMLLRQQVLELIDTKLLFADFRRTVPEENMAKIKENLEKPFAEHEIPRLVKMLEVKDRHELIELLNKYESSIHEVKRSFIERTIAGEWLKQRIPVIKPVTREQMLEYYQGHIQDYEYPAQVQWEELMVRLDRLGGDRSKAWRGIAEMGNDVWWQASQEANARGAVFQEIAKARSHGLTAQKGGRHDWTTIDSLRCQALNDALFSLKVGQMSNILESERGFHIVRVLQRKAAGRTPFTEAQSAIREKLEGRQRKELVAQEMLKLRKNSQVWTVFDGHLKAEKLAQVLSSRKRR